MPALASRGRGRRTINEINMVPFIDVMLVLLIIFMVTAPLITPSMIDLPSIGKAGKQPDQVIQVIIGRDQLVKLRIRGEDSATSLQDVAGAVKRAQGSQDPAVSSAVVISADRNVRYETVVSVMDRLQKSGVQRIGLSVQLEK